MFLSILHLLSVLADKRTTTMASASVTTPGKSVLTTTTAKESPTDKETTASTSIIKVASTISEDLNPKEICVKCYNEFVTPDCTNTCSCKCDDGSKSVKAVKKPTQCPNVDPKEVPCPCKDEYNNIIPENSYIKRENTMDIGN